MCAHTLFKHIVLCGNKKKYICIETLSMIVLVITLYLPTSVSFCIIRLQALLGQALYSILWARITQLLPFSTCSINVSWLSEWNSLFGYIRKNQLKVHPESESHNSSVWLEGKAQSKTVDNNDFIWFKLQFSKRDSDFGNLQFANHISGICGNPFQLTSSYRYIHVPTKGKRANNFISLGSLLTSDLQAVAQ